MGRGSGSVGGGKGEETNAAMPKRPRRDIKVGGGGARKNGVARNGGQVDHWVGITNCWCVEESFNIIQIRLEMGNY